MNIGILSLKNVELGRKFLNLRRICAKLYMEVCEISHVPNSIKHICHDIGQKDDPCLLELYGLYSGLVECKAKKIDSFYVRPTKQVRKELDSHRLAGPFQFPPLHPFRISPVGVVPKKTPGEFHLIHHLSYPWGSSVNDGIDSEHTRVCYATVDDAIKFIKLTGPGCFLAKTDIKNAFRIIPIRPDDYNLLGMQ